MTHEIFVPFWGDPQLLFDTVDSVRAQRSTDWRMIILDDCYPDESVPAYFAALDDPRVEYIRNEKNLGITENYREAIRRATSPFITILAATISCTRTTSMSSSASSLGIRMRM